MRIKPKTRKIVLIGSGNVATHLGKMLSNTREFAVIQIYSKTMSHARSLGNKLNIPWACQLQDININADIYILAVKDDMISAIGSQLADKINSKAVVIHTSGSTSAVVLKPYFKYIGVLYPLMTFSKKKKNISLTIPCFVTGAGKYARSIIIHLAESISNQVKEVSDETRSFIHLSAVLVNNFPNYLYIMADRILKSKKIEFEVLLPLIEETTAKLKTLSPIDAQTGPARRHDLKTINMHNSLLKKYFPTWSAIYLQLSGMIQAEFNQRN